MAIPALLKYLWASPASALGGLFALLAAPFGARVGLRTGVLEVTLARRARKSRVVERSRPFVAITLGHVVIAASQADQARLRAHERVHVAQYERWGVLFLVAYPVESVLQFLLGRRPYLDNRFEIEARHLASGLSGGTRLQ